MATSHIRWRAGGVSPLITESHRQYDERLVYHRALEQVKLADELVKSAKVVVK